MGPPFASAIEERRPRLTAAACGALTACAWTLAYAPPALWALTLLAPTPLIWLALRTPRPVRAGLYASLGVLPFWVWTHAWTAEISRAGVYPLTGLLALFTFLFVWVLGRAARRWDALGSPTLAPWAGATAWAGVEVFRGSVAFDGYAFYLTAHPLIDAFEGALARPAAWVGAYGVSWLAVLPAACAAAWAARGRLPVATLAGVGAVIVVWGAAAAWPRPRASGPSVRVAVVQSNVPQDNRSDWTFRQRVADWVRLRDLTVRAASNAPDLIVWPEGMFPGRVLDADALAVERASDAVWSMQPRHDGDAPELGGVADYVAASSIADELLILQGALGIPMIVGAAGYDGFRTEPDGSVVRNRFDAMYNAAFVVNRGEVAHPRYDKLHLAPFGEVMPYISAWPWLERRLLAIGAEGMSFVLSPGREPVVLEVQTAEGPLGVATPICFEATVPGVCRGLVFGPDGRRAALLATLTNDGWFGSSTMNREHYALASRWRCVELDTPMVRAANTGISAAYDRAGRVIADRVTLDDGSLGPRDRVWGVLTADLPVAVGVTVYARIEDAFGWVCLAVTAGMAAAGFVPRARGATKGDSDAATA